MSCLTRQAGDIVSLHYGGRYIYREENIMASETYEDLIEEIETKLDEADKAAAEDDVRYTADEVFRRVRERIGDKL